MAFIKPKDVQVGHRFVIHHTSGVITVKVEYISEHTSFNGLTRHKHFSCRNEKTGRMIVVKSAAKFREFAETYEARQRAYGSGKPSSGWATNDPLQLTTEDHRRLGMGTDLFPSDAEREAREQKAREFLTECIEKSGEPRE